MRTIKTSPLRLWVASQIHSPVDDMTEEELNSLGVEGIGNWWKVIDQYLMH